MIEQSNREVAYEIGHEERPIVLRHSFRREVDVVDHVDPHVACIVRQVLTEVLSGIIVEQIFPIRSVQSRGDSNLAVDTDFVKVCTARIIRQSTLFLVKFFLTLLSSTARAFKDVGSETGSVARAEWTVSLIWQSVQRSNNECERCLCIVNSCPLVVLFDGNTGLIVLPVTVHECMVHSFGHKLNFIDFAFLLCNFMSNAPLFLDLVHAPLCLLKDRIGLLLALPLGWYILFVCW